MEWWLSKEEEEVFGILMELPQLLAEREASSSANTGHHEPSVQRVQIAKKKKMENSLPFKKRKRFMNALLLGVNKRYRNCTEGNAAPAPSTSAITNDQGPSLQPIDRQPQPAADVNVERLQAVADGMRMPRLRLYLSKTITKTDTCRVAHRYQLTCNDIDNVPALKALKGRVVTEGVPVNIKVLDKHANEYDLVFSCMACNGNCRIIGPDWTRFLVDSAMHAGETMDVYGSCNDKGDFLFALVNTQ